MKFLLVACVTWIIYVAIGLAITIWLSLGPVPQILLGLVIAVFWVVGNEWFQRKQHITTGNSEWIDVFSCKT
ncbi:MAG: holin [Myoviridae sp. ctThM1]|nr:MAG: holin [Myoviridae sp. ctThM1]